MDVRLVIKHRLEELGLDQRELAVAAGVTESYISQLLTRKKAPPSTDRTGLYERMNAFLRLPKGRLSAMVEAQRREELKKTLADPPAPLFKEVRELVIRKCKHEKQAQVREIFEKQAFGELERLVTQKLLDVTKRIAKDELKNASWLRSVAKMRDRSYEEMRAIILQFLDTSVFNLSPDHCSAFLDPLIDSWDIDLGTFGMEIVLNRRLAPTQLMKFHFVQMESEESLEGEPGFLEFLRNLAMSGDATEEEIEFLKRLRFTGMRPSPLYYYRELQNLRDPLHFRERSGSPMHKRRHAGAVKKQTELDSRKNAIQRWANNKPKPGEKPTVKPSSTSSRRSRRT
jgi:transcriptional regulator with XRE-family HTH domain